MWKCMTAYLLVVFFVQFQKQEDQSVVDDLVSKLDSGWKKVQPFIQIAVVSEFISKWIYAYYVW